MINERGQVEPVKELLVIIVGGPLYLALVHELATKTAANWAELATVTLLVALMIMVRKGENE